MLPKPRVAILLILGMLGATGCSTATPGPASTAARAAENYVLGAGDTLNIFVYRAPELSATDLPVRPDGRISLPLVPDIQAAGRTPTALARQIEGQLRTFVRDPNVTVMVRGFQGPPGRQIRIIGEAAQPMAMPYREGLTVLDVVIAARGLTRYAAGNRATIVRRGGEGTAPEVIPVRLADLMRGGDVGQDLPLQPGDTLVIPQGWF